MSGRCSSRHGWERADSLDREFEDPIPLPSGKTLKSLRGAGDYIDLPEKESGKPHWQTAIRELMIAAERSGHDAGANRDAESVEPWETGADATAQGGEEISDREIAAFAGHSPKNARGLPNIKGRRHVLRPALWLELGIANPYRDSRHKFGLVHSSHPMVRDFSPRAQSYPVAPITSQSIQQRSLRPPNRKA